MAIVSTFSAVAGWRSGSFSSAPAIEMLESVFVLIPVYVVGVLAIVLFLLFLEQWNRAERLQKQLDTQKRELQVASESLTQIESQIGVVAAQREWESSRGQHKKAHSR